MRDRIEIFTKNESVFDMIWSTEICRWLKSWIEQSKARTIQSLADELGVNYKRMYEVLIACNLYMDFIKRA